MQRRAWISLAHAGGKCNKSEASTQRERTCAGFLLLRRAGIRGRLDVGDGHLVCCRLRAARILRSRRIIRFRDFLEEFENATTCSGRLVTRGRRLDKRGLLTRAHFPAYRCCPMQGRKGAKKIFETSAMHSRVKAIFLLRKGRRGKETSGGEGLLFPILSFFAVALFQSFSHQFGVFLW